MNARPPIESWNPHSIPISYPDGLVGQHCRSFLVAAGKHFDNLFERYGTPLIILNLAEYLTFTSRVTRLSLAVPSGVNLEKRSSSLSTPNASTA